MSDEASREPPRLLDFAALAARLRTVTVVLAVLAVAATVIDGLLGGLTFGVMLRWAGVFVVAMLLCAGVSVAVQALRGVDAAQRRGERLSGGDVGLVPPRRPRD